MSQEKTVEQLNDQLAAAHAALDEALASGGDTTGPRYQIGLIEAEIAAAVRRQREEQAEAECAQQAAIDDSAAELAAKTHATVHAAVDVAGLVELSGEPLPAVPQDSAIDAAARELARCRVVLDRAEAVLKPIAAQAEMLAGRLSEKRTAIAALKARRLAGDERAGDAAELAMLQADFENLQLLADDARLKVQAADTRAAARAALANAEQQLEQARRQAEYRSALERVNQAQMVFLGLYGAMVRAGRAAGHSSPWSAFKASPNLVRAVTGQLLPGASNPFFN